MSGHTTFSEVGKWGAIMLGMILAVPVIIVLSSDPVVLLWGAFLLFLGWAGVRSGFLSDDDDVEAVVDADPLKTLQERYAAGELTEVEFEERLDRILQSDERAERTGERRSAEPTGERRSAERTDREHALE